MQASKAVRLLSLLPKRPVEFYDRVMTVVEVNWERRRARLPPGNGTAFHFVDALSGGLNLPVSCISEMLEEGELGRIEGSVSEGIAKAKGTGPFDSGHNGDFSLARSAYVMCRVLSPDVVVETGVAYGVTSAFVLQALAVNGGGTLISVDLPPLGRDADGRVGAFVPQELRERWRLHRGPVKRILPSVLAAAGKVGLFIHDSLHTYRNMKFEFEAVWPYLGPGAVLMADDVGLNDAFQDFVAKAKPAFWAVVKEESKDALFGVLVKGA